MTTSPSSPNAARYLLTVRSLTPVCGVIAEMDFDAAETKPTTAENPKEGSFSEELPTEEDETEDLEFELADEESDEDEEVEFELADEEEEDEEEVEFELADDEEDEEEEVEFELAEGSDEDEDEDVIFELAEDPDDENSEPLPPLEEGIAEDPALRERTVTLKKYVRGFLAKMKQGSPERKTLYTELKAKILSMSGVKTRSSFSGEAFYRGRTNLVRVRLRGKTICLFLALDVDQYKQTVYHHQYKGDVKAYADTPMMIRVKTDVGFQKALFLIDEVGRRFGLPIVSEPDKKKIRREYNYAETAELMDKGLIKTRYVKVPYYEAQELLKKKKD